jgi:acetyl esterase/lipase
VKNLWGLTELNIVKAFVCAESNSVKDVFIERQTVWKINASKGEVIECHNNSERKQIRCRLLKSENSNHHNSVVLYIHGGGFVSQSPDSHEVYLRDWSIQLQGIHYYY